MTDVYDPEAFKADSYLKLWGTRGSVPVSGPSHSAFGGDTCCLEIRKGKTVIVIDAGTGIRALGDQLVASDIREIHLFFGHTHWDHIIGFPFFTPLYNHEFTIHIYAEGDKIEGALAKVLRPDYFPVRLDQLRANIIYHSVPVGEPIQINEVKVTTCQVNHPGGALGFRIETKGRKIGYVTDNEFLEGHVGNPHHLTLDDEIIKPYLPIIEFFKECDPLIHEAQYTPREYGAKVGWGHSSLGNASALVRLANVRSWFITHHEPSADDLELRRRIRLAWQIITDGKFDCRVNFTFDRLTLPL